MKKKIIAILISVLLILVSFTFGGCFKSCLEPPTPTKNDVIKNIKRLWGMPVISAVLFQLGSWIFFSMGERAFIWYAGVYLILGIVAMTISMR